jgi:autotransporter-associated beta strand protein
MDSRRATLNRRPRRILQTSLALTGAMGWLLLPNTSLADILGQYNFGTTPAQPSLLSPTAVFPSVTVTNITAGSGNTLDLTNSQTPAPASAPWLRVVPTGAWTTGDAAVAGNGYFEFSLSPAAGFMMDLASIAFDVMRGGASTPRGYDVRTSVNNFATTIGSAAVGTQRPTFTNVNIDLSALVFQDLPSITFRIYTFAPATAVSVEYDNITINGTLQSTGFTGYTWTGAVNNSWNTTTANWSGVGTTYPDGLATSNVLFGDGPTATNVTVDALSLSPNAVTFNNSGAYSLTGGAVNIATLLTKDGVGSAVIDNAVTAGAVSVVNGTLAVTLSGAITAPTVAIGVAGVLSVEDGGTISDTTTMQVTGSLVLKAAAQTLAALNGPASGIVTLENTELTVTGASSYAGSITGPGSIRKVTPGTLILGGATSDYSGGTVVSAGALQLTQASAAGIGPVRVEPGGTLILGAAVSAPLELTGGTVGVSAAVTFPGDFPVANDITVATFNPATGVGSNDLILTGRLLGSGNINFLSINGNNPDNQAFRLRGPASDYSGTITLAQSAKFEIQTSVAFGSPMGTGSLVLTGGTVTTTAAGTYTLVNVRNNSAAAGIVSDAQLGNNVRMQGQGTAYFNMLGTVAAGSVSQFGDLQIGAGQEVGAVATAGSGLVLGFSTVHLTGGGNAAFVPQPIGNTSFIAPHHIRLGTISEDVPESGIEMKGAGTLTLTGVNTYTGPTLLRSGTTVLATGSSIASSSPITIDPGATLDTTPLGVFEVPDSRIITVNGSLTGTVLLRGALFGGGTIQGHLNALAASLVSPGAIPGASHGALTMQNFTLEQGAVLEMEVSKSTPGGQPIVAVDYDALFVTNTPGGPSSTVALGGALSLVPGVGIEQNDIFNLIINTSTDPTLGEFDGIPHGTTFAMGGMSFQISYSDDSTTPAFELSGGNDVSVIAIPEPGSAVLMFGGLAACAIRRTRSQRSVSRASRR